MHLRLLTVGTLLLVMLGRSLAAAEIHHTEAPVIVEGQRIVALRTVVAGYSPAERAAVVAGRLAGLLDRPGPGNVTLETVPEGALLTLDGSPVLLLVVDDAQRVVGETLASVAEDARQAVENLVRDHRRPLSAEALWWRLGAVALSTMATPLPSPCCFGRVASAAS